MPAPATPLQEPEASGDTPAADADETEKKQKPKKEKKPPKEKKPQGGKKETKLGLHAKKSEEFGDWYSQVCTESEMITYYEGVSGKIAKFTRAEVAAATYSSVHSSAVRGSGADRCLTSNQEPFH